MITTTSTNPILDFYIAAHTAGQVKRPIHTILNMPSRDGKSLTAFRFSQIEHVLFLAGDTTAQGFRNKVHALHKQGKDFKLNLVVVEDASKIRAKVREDFFALCAQFAAGTVNVDQNGMDFSFKTHASVIINTPPFFYKTLEYYLLSAGCGDRFDTIITGLSDKEKAKLEKYGEYNMPNRILPVELPELNTISYPDYADKNRKYGHDIKVRYACACAGIDENLVQSLNNNTIKSADWSNYWEDQITPPIWVKGTIKTRLAEYDGL